MQNIKEVMTGRQAVEIATWAVCNVKHFLPVLVISSWNKTLYSSNRRPI